jgi:dihydropteroate synthase
MDKMDQWFEKRNKVLVMGVLNLTSDSFYDGGYYNAPQNALKRAMEMVEQGADIIDVGGESSRPGASPVSVEDELQRVIPMVEEIGRRCDVMISVDTTKSAVAQVGLEHGAKMINDISAMRYDPDMFDVVAQSGAFLVLMHMQGTPKTMQRDPSYRDVVAEIKDFLQERIGKAVRSGIGRQRLIVDPGIGFGKRLVHNLEILRRLSEFKDLEVPIMIGLSRKSFLGDILDVPVGERLTGTIAANSIAVANGADIIRVHDVKEGRQAADVAVRLRSDAP